MDNGRMTEPLDAADPAKGRMVPSLGLLHFVQMLNGLGTMLLGPILPLLAAHWRLNDTQSGMLLLSQFCGAFLGGVSTSARLRRDTLTGLAAATAGLFVFAAAHALPWACAGLVLAGFGIGRAITTVNIIAGSRATLHRGSALARVNLSWSAGALLSPLLAAWLTPHIALSHLLSGFAALYLLSTLRLLWENRKASPELSLKASGEAPEILFPNSIFFYFFLLLFLYGGLETCLSGWLTTFALRYGRDSLVLSEYTLVLLLSGLTAGRALAAWLLLRLRNLTLVRIALALSVGLSAGLARAHQTASIAGLAVLLGITLAPVFPATFAMLLAHRPPPRKAGIVMAASGLGASALPALMGLVSTHSGSLQRALILPITAAAVLFALSFLPASAETKTGGS